VIGEGDDDLRSLRRKAQALAQVANDDNHYQHRAEDTCAALKAVLCPDRLLGVCFSTR
jgi:hypothetical protein